MKKVIFFLFFLTVGLFAEHKICPLDHHFSFGPKYVRAAVKPSGHPSFHGNMGGMEILYEYGPGDFLYGAGAFDWAYGKVHAGNGKRDLLDINVCERLGYTWSFWNRDFLLSLFSGFGYRHLDHDVKINHMSSIDLHYNHFYLPIGLLTHTQINSFFSIGGNVIWKGQLFSTVHISPIGGAHWKIQKKYKNVLVELPLTFLVHNPTHFSLVFVPYFELWQDGHTTARSSSGLQLNLPQNTNIFWGAQLNLRFSF